MSKLLPPLGELPWVVNEKPLSEKKVAIITTAGLNFRQDHNFEFVDSVIAPYREILPPRIS